MLPDVVFFGSGAFGLPVLRMLAEAGRVALVVSQPDRVAGRGKQITPTPVSEFALEHGGRSELRGHNEFGGLAQEVEVVADLLVDLT